MKLISSIGIVMGLLCASLAAASATARERGPFARSVDQVDAIWVDTNSCMDSLNREMDDRGFFTAGSPSSSDAILEVNVRPLDRYVTAARYTATLRGRNGRPLLSIEGRKESLSHAELCAEISESIIRRMEDRMG